MSDETKELKLLLCDLEALTKQYNKIIGENNFDKAREINCAYTNSIKRLKELNFNVQSYPLTLEELTK